MKYKFFIKVVNYVSLNESINKLAKQYGISYFGVADLTYAYDAILEQGGPNIAKYPYAISLGIALINDIVDQLPNRSRRDVAVNYKHHAYDIINQRLDITASLISSFIQDKGYNVLPIPASKRYDDERICASFSHKLGAHLAGLGWIGKSCLLVTPDHGPRVRWISILTNAPLIPTSKQMEEKCGECNKCVTICPVKAFTNRSFKKDEPRELRYNARKCEKYFESMKEKEKVSVCGMCLYICPYGNRE